MSTMPPPREESAVSPGTTRVGVVGVGRMGANIARRLRDAGYTVAAVSDAARERARELGGEIGAQVP
ncbi:MAG TPA: NAD(P)-binding domain-containing protein, partial [Candidatus Elarobacter sp.]